MAYPLRRVAALGVCALLALPAWASAQGPTVDTPDSDRVPESTSLGPVPGSGGTRGGAPADISTILGGRPGPSVPRVPTSVNRPGPGMGMGPTPGVTLPAVVPFTEAPLYGPLSVPTEAADDGPANGLTIDMAIERLVGENLDLRAQYHEIPKARADILTASLRANPIFYADSQLIPYGSYTQDRPGGATQYDVNITYPLDVSHKRQARTAVASQAKRVIEAQYQDAVRQQIDHLYTAYVEALGARETLRYAEASTTGLVQLLDKTQKLFKGGEKTRGDVERIRIQYDSARIGQSDAEEALRAAKSRLAPLLRMNPIEAENLELRGTINDLAPLPPPNGDLFQIAMNSRADFVALRLGIRLAEADVKLAHAERFQDIYVLYQPYTFQNNTPFGTKSAHSWALGVTVPMPIYNRNQGNIQRAQTNVSQTKTQLAAAELRILTEVRQAEREYHVSRAAVEQIERGLLPGARKVRDEILRRYNQGEAALVDYLLAQRDYNDIVRQYRDTQVRHRRSMFALNTAVGMRILP
ncbi:outer membrane protein, cobalt-zinc-cadmium efflux system [Singulisphaera sp. GP187]|uniref:TolC family protein n=1 Tax=Singulisphaera sp. GP187 TaxID=1882752 RepID=UPI00092C47C8|nr:TolC family protein [Singulisphaera sp. GP187]SIN68578.1 outer membrane protein, cobalt-zinc-cadmium efflux system [Singulisphaera sp. GP187]